MEPNKEAQPASTTEQIPNNAPEDSSNAKSQEVPSPGTLATDKHELLKTGAPANHTEATQSVTEVTTEKNMGKVTDTESSMAAYNTDQPTTAPSHEDSHSNNKEATHVHEDANIIKTDRVTNSAETKTSSSHEETAAVSAESSHRHTSGRPESLLVSPLTHPNGVDMFPSLSATEQEQISWEAFTQAEESIVAEGFRDDASDGGYQSEGFSSGSTSAESSVRDYMYENGRRYHRFREGAYNFPNDDVEQEREDMKHAMVKLLCGQKLFFAPIGDNPQQILDIGTGTGIWVIEMGDQFPSASVLGIDLSPIQPDWLPPNVRFIVDDAESPWLYPRNHFDYIHSRHTVMALKDWMRLFRRALEHLKPGGWIELQEIHHCPRSANPEADLPEDHQVAQFWSNVSAGLGKLGVDLNISSGGQLTKMLQEAGYVNVTERVFHVPIGTWPKNKVLKTVGLYWRTILLDGLQAIALGPMVRGLGWKREEVEVFLTGVRTAYHDNAALMYMPLHIIYAQKPENME
ncbi:hypothetical protein NLG97_g478 [Lecanicillium saksenae]|uniref:Uncharacterized protein n=1 Tax=Lecanicillium saksenae TaxID=468837 RepID=A0ACC1R7V7_9HYPO|nr:hypothetical protein NLG97_g478 [Lecanicillium saksenae]